MYNVKYAVVRFRGDDSQTEISVVPLIWIRNDSCFWPKKNIRTNIIKRNIPRDDWDVYQCSVINKFKTYEEALREEKKAVASSESEGEVRQGKRKIKPKKYLSYDDLPALSDYEVFENDKDQELEKDEASQEASEQSEGSNDLQSVSPVDDISTDTPNEETIIVTDSIDEIPMIIDKNNFKTLMENIFEMKTMLQLILQRVNNLEKNDDTHNDILKDTKIKNMFPMESVDKLLEIEEAIKIDEEVRQQLLNKLTLVGGANHKNFLRRCLSLMFSNTLATKCSWTGQKNNFKIGDTELMDILIKASKNAGFVKNSNKEMEQVIMEWFRFAKQRLQRE